MKVKHKTNIRVEVTFDEDDRKKWLMKANLDNLEEYLFDKAKAVAEQIERHCDDYDTVGAVYDTVILCSHCGLEWEDTYDADGPMCCEKAQAEWEKETGKVMAED